MAVVAAEAAEISIAGILETIGGDELAASITKILGPSLADIGLEQMLASGMLSTAATIDILSDSSIPDYMVLKILKGMGLLREEIEKLFKYIKNKRDNQAGRNKRNNKQRGIEEFKRMVKNISSVRPGVGAVSASEIFGAGAGAAAGAAAGAPIYGGPSSRGGDSEGRGAGPDEPEEEKGEKLKDPEPGEDLKERVEYFDREAEAGDVNEWTPSLIFYLFYGYFSQRGLLEGLDIDSQIEETLRALRNIQSTSGIDLANPANYPDSWLPSNQAGDADIWASGDWIGITMSSVLQNKRLDPNGVLDVLMDTLSPFKMSEASGQIVGPGGSRASGGAVSAGGAGSAVDGAGASRILRPGFRPPLGGGPYEPPLYPTPPPFGGGDRDVGRVDVGDVTAGPSRIYTPGRGGVGQNAVDDEVKDNQVDNIREDQWEDFVDLDIPEIEPEEWVDADDPEDFFFDLEDVDLQADIERVAFDIPDGYGNVSSVRDLLMELVGDRAGELFQQIREVMSTRWEQLSNQARRAINAATIRFRMPTPTRAQLIGIVGILIGVGVITEVVGRGGQRYPPFPIPRGPERKPRKPDDPPPDEPEEDEKDKCENKCECCPETDRDGHIPEDDDDPLEENKEHPQANTEHPSENLTSEVFELSPATFLNPSFVNNKTGFKQETGLSFQINEYDENNPLQRMNFIEDAIRYGGKLFIPEKPLAKPMRPTRGQLKIVNPNNKNEILSQKPRDILNVEPFSNAFNNYVIDTTGLNKYLNDKMIYNCFRRR